MEQLNVTFFNELSISCLGHCTPGGVEILEILSRNSNPRYDYRQFYIVYVFEYECNLV